VSFFGEKEWLQDRLSQGPRTLGRDVDGAAAATGDRGRRRTGATAGGGGQIRELFLKIGLKRRVSLLRRGKASRLQRLAERTEILLQGVCGLTAAVVMVMVTLRLTRLLLDVLLDGGEIGLCGGEVTRLQVLAKCLERFGEGAGWRGGATRGNGRSRRRLLAIRKFLRECREIGLRLGQVSRLQVLAEFLELSLNLLKLGLRTLRN
jgi:hypothetical protein